MSEEQLTLDFDSVKEEWRPILGYEGAYEVSNLGRVRSVARIIPRLGINGSQSYLPVQARLIALTVQCDGSGRIAVNLYKGNKLKRFYVSVLMLEAFVSPRPFPETHACHNDGDNQNNVLTNLRWDTQRGNVIDSIVQGTHNVTKLSEEDVIALRTYGHAIKTGTLVRIFGVDRHTIRAILTGKTWKWLKVEPKPIRGIAA